MSDFRRAVSSVAAVPPAEAALDLRLALWLAAAACWYALLVCAGSPGLTAPVPHGLAFNSMAQHLLQGRFDVDPPTIGDEGYLRDGAVYAYFGIFPALFRLLFLPLANFATTDFTRIGCLCAVLLMAVFKALSVRVVAAGVAGEAKAALTGLMLVALLAGGAQVEFLRPSIFQEVGLWAAACAAGFVYLFLRGWAREEGFTPALLNLMALAAGICLLTRVSTALGLYLALGFLWLVLAWRRRRVGPFGPIAILLGFAAVAGAINLARWGNPLVFVDLSRALMLGRFPERAAVVRDYGEFNPLRLGYGLSYYLLPVWALPDGAGGLLWSAFRDRLFVAVELPPASLFVSEPLLVALAACGIADIVRRRDMPLLAALAGFLVPIGLMLIAVSLTFRYRLEFYPFLELAAFVGLARLIPSAGARARGWVTAGAAASVLMAQAMWVLTMLSPFGPVQTVIGTEGVAAFYRSLFEAGYFSELM